ncbi:MAG: transposase [Terracidiphilus sp.]
MWTKWQGLLAEQKQSGQSVAAFCRERGLGNSQFFAWKKRLQEAGAGLRLPSVPEPAA